MNRAHSPAPRACMVPVGHQVTASAIESNTEPQINYDNNSNSEWPADYLDLLSDFLCDFDVFDPELRSELVRECDLDLLLEWCRPSSENTNGTWRRTCSMINMMLMTLIITIHASVTYRVSTTFKCCYHRNFW